MAAVVTTAGSLTCADGGKPTLTSGAKLTVKEKPVLLYPDVPTFNGDGPPKPGWTGCTFQLNGVSKPCQTAVPLPTVPPGKGKSGKLTAGSAPVLLADLMAGTDNPPPPPAQSVTVAAGQAKLTAS